MQYIQRGRAVKLHGRDTPRSTFATTLARPGVSKHLQESLSISRSPVCSSPQIKRNPKPSNRWFEQGKRREPIIGGLRSANPGMQAYLYACRKSERLSSKPFAVLRLFARMRKATGRSLRWVSLQLVNCQEAFADRVACDQKMADTRGWREGFAPALAVRLRRICREQARGLT